MTTGELGVRDDGHVLHVALNAPATRNALSIDMLDEMAALLERPHTAAGCRCVVVSSAEEGMFCSGFRLDGGAAEALRSGSAASAADRLFEAMTACPVPVVGVVDGPAHGGGCELALRCHLRIATPRATFAVPSGRLGLAYTPSSVSFMVNQIGPQAGSWLMLSGQRIAASTALQWGLVHQVFEPEEMEEAARAIVDGIASSAPLVLAYLRAAIAAASPGHEVPPAVLERRDGVLASDDFNEAIEAIEQQRPPLFEGR